MADAVLDALHPGETLQWRGRPRPSAPPIASGMTLRILGVAGLIAVTAGAAITVRALFSAIGHQEYFEASFLFVLSLIMLAMFAASVRFLMRPPHPGESLPAHFAITTHRVMIVEEGSPPKIRSLTIDQNLEIEDATFPDGGGQLTFRAADDTAFNIDPLMFDDLDDAATPLKILRERLEAVR